jgi:site-specific DNA-adenine methylase
MNEDDTIDKYIIANKIYCIRSGLFPLKTVKESYNFYEIFTKAPIYNFLKTEKITFTNMDALECYEKYKNDINNFIFLDPPYLSLCNDFYHESNVNIYEYLYKNKITNQSAFIMLVLNKIWIIDLLFINEIKLTYSKNYFNNITRGVEHLLISNK